MAIELSKQVRQFINNTADGIQTYEYRCESRAKIAILISASLQRIIDSQCPGVTMHLGFLMVKLVDFKKHLPVVIITKDIDAVKATSHNMVNTSQDKKFSFSWYDLNIIALLNSVSIF